MVISTYLALTRPPERGVMPDNLPARPPGTVIWAACVGAQQHGAMTTLARKLADDGEDITIIATLPETSDLTRYITPNTRRACRMFLNHWQPDIVLWVGGAIEPAVMFEMAQSTSPCILVDADTSAIEIAKGRRVPGLIRRSLRAFDEVLTIDDDATMRLIKAGANPNSTRAIGRLEDGLNPLACDETERSALTQILLARPIWLAADLPLSEVEMVADAYRHAARRAHRTLLVLAPRSNAQAHIMVDELRRDGFSVCSRSLGEKPKDSTQIYIVDTDDGLGLWCRLSPITYLGGSMTDGKTIDPFIPALVGSAVLSGPKTTNNTDHFDRLAAKDAMTRVHLPDALGTAVEKLLATDHAAQMAHAAWDVTSRGADATNDLVNLIYGYLDGVGN